MFRKYSSLILILLFLFAACRDYYEPVKPGKVPEKEKEKEKEEEKEEEEEEDSWGIFGWSIEYPLNVSEASMTIIPLDKTKGTPEQTLYFIGGEPLVNKSDSITLNTGHYQVIFNLFTSEQQSAVKSDELHISPDEDSFLKFIFGADDFTELFSVKELTFPELTQTINLGNLSGNDIYLVKVNKSNALVAGALTGDIETGYHDFLPMDHEAAIQFNANPPPRVETLRRTRAVFTPPVVGDTRDFWVETFFNSGQWTQKRATLRATGVYGNIWVMDENFGVVAMGNRITKLQAENLAKRFDLIYPAEVNLLGYEYGGGPDGDGGMDEDPKIQILVYGIVDASGKAMAGGYYWSKDYYPQATLFYSNQAEIFYINASSINNTPDYAYAILVHEFQHMINYNEKNIKQGISPSTWYNEMLSMMAEDVILPLIGIEPGNKYHPTQQRMPAFIETYNQVGITEWTSLEISSYANGYAFGAYLLRNYGGADLLKIILSNDKVNIDSLSLALNEILPGMDFEQALARYGEAIIFSAHQIPEDVMSFDKTVSSTVNGIKYTAYGFDIWNMERYSSPVQGPVIFDLTQMQMRPYSISVHSSSEWKGKTGNFSITLTKPSDDIVLFLVVK